MAPSKKSFRKFNHRYKLKIGSGIKKPRQFFVKVAQSTASSSSQSTTNPPEGNEISTLGLGLLLDPPTATESASLVLDQQNHSEENINRDGAELINRKTDLNSYERRKMREESCWENMREKLQKVHVNQQYLATDTVCVICVDENIKPRKAVCRCQDCGWQQNFCIQCATAIHSNKNMFHILELWKVSCDVGIIARQGRV